MIGQWMLTRVMNLRMVATELCVWNSIHCVLSLGPVEYPADGTEDNVEQTIQERDEGL